MKKVLRISKVVVSLIYQKRNKMTTTQITNRIAELNTVIANALKSTTVESAAIWTAAVKERSELKNRL